MNTSKVEALKLAMKMFNFMMDEVMREEGVETVTLKRKKYTRRTTPSVSVEEPVQKRRKMSAKAKANIRAGIKKRWAAYHKANGKAGGGKKK